LDLLGWGWFDLYTRELLVFMIVLLLELEMLLLLHEILLTDRV
jgi:hypothetical protein